MFAGLCVCLILVWFSRGLRNLVCAWLLLFLISYLQWCELFGCSLFGFTCYLWFVAYCVWLVCWVMLDLSWFGFVAYGLCWVVGTELLLLVRFWLGFGLFACLLLWVLN